MSIVFCKGKYWFYEGLPDYEGRVSLVSIKDPSCGYNAKPQDVHFLTPTKEKEISEAIAYLRRAS